MNFFFYNILPHFLSIYDRGIHFRLKKAWGIANLRLIKNKGENVSVVGYTRFINPDNIRLGNNVRIGSNCFLFGKGGITIGDGTILSRNITIYSSNHNYKATNLIPYNEEYVNKPVKIGKGVWIGMGASITPGVEIGDGAIIGMGTVISKNILPGEIVVGAGQRTITKRDIENFYKLLDQKKFFSSVFPDK